MSARAAGLIRAFFFFISFESSAKQRRKMTKFWSAVEDVSTRRLIHTFVSKCLIHSSQYHLYKNNTQATNRQLNHWRVSLDLKWTRTWFRVRFVLGQFANCQLYVMRIDWKCLAYFFLGIGSRCHSNCWGIRCVTNYKAGFLILLKRTHQLSSNLKDQVTVHLIRKQWCYF